MKMTTRIDLTREEKEICSNCGCRTRLVYDLFGDGLILYCEDCYKQWLANNSRIAKKLRN